MKALVKKTDQEEQAERGVYVKKAKTAYQIFWGQMKSQMCKQDEYKSLSHADMARFIGDSWLKLAEEQKA